MSEDMHYTQLV